MARNTTQGELEALAALTGGVDSAADLIGLDDELYQRALDDEELSRREEAEIDRRFAEFQESGEPEVTDWERLSITFEFELSPNVVGSISDGIRKRAADAVKQIRDLERRIENARTQRTVNKLTKELEGWQKIRDNPADEMLKALEEVQWDVYDRENAFWEWFREIYG